MITQKSSNFENTLFFLDIEGIEQDELLDFSKQYLKYLFIRLDKICISFDKIQGKNM